MKGNATQVIGNSLFSCLSDVEIKDTLARGSIAAMIANKRRKLNLNQKEFAKKLGVTQGMISKWENLEYSFTISKLLELMDKLNVDVEILLDGKSITSSPQSTPLKELSRVSQDGWKTNFQKFSNNDKTSEEGAA